LYNVEDYGVIICNPPYGERIGEQQEVETINKDMGKHSPNMIPGQNT